MATVNLGSIKFNWQGAYNGATAYAVDDVVSYNGSSYICKLASTGNLPTNTTYFDQMSSAGTNGTDLTSTLTTQGDLVYRDGSGLQRLGAGTAGQVLQTGGAGANPSWGTLSSDVVNVSTTASTSGTTVNFEDVFTSDYQYYKVIIGGWYMGGDNSPVFRLLSSGSTAISSSSYYWTGIDTGIQQNGVTTYNSHNSNYNMSYVRLQDNFTGDSDFKSGVEITFFEPTASGKHPIGRFNHACYSSTSWLEQQDSAWTYWGNQTYTGFQLYNTASSTNYLSNVRIYGYK